MGHPYETLEPRAFWRSAIAEDQDYQLPDFYRPRFEITRTDRIAAAGSCFAQHISAQFKSRDYNFLDLEPPPPLLPEKLWPAFGYDLYSARYGNIYTARQWRQLIERAFGRFQPLEPVWQANGRFFDPFRPAIEPDGFCSRDEFQAIQERHLKAVVALCEQLQVFVFTFGLTEAWVHRGDGAVYPVCPGTAAGTFNPDKYAFHNFGFPEIVEDTMHVIEFLRSINPDIRFLFTVSPVPLTATASGQHVLAATVYSKSVLRAVCGHLQSSFECVDYFPSYEIIASHPGKARFFEPNLRSVAPAGVAHVMQHFFGDAAAPPRKRRRRRRERIEEKDADDLICEEELLDAFA